MKKVTFAMLQFGLFCMIATCSLFGQNVEEGNFKKTVLTRDFISEGVAVADLNKDGLLDIIAGYYWFKAPNWEKHEGLCSRR